MANFTDYKTVTMTSMKSLNNQIHSCRESTLYHIKDISGLSWAYLKAMNNGL